MTSTSRSARLAKWLSIPAGLVLSALLVWQASYAAFSDTTSNTGNSWEAGTMELTDDDADSALFTATDLAPGDSGTNYIRVEYTGSFDADVSFYGKNLTTTDRLADHIHLQVEIGEGGEFGSGAGFVPFGAPIYNGTLTDFRRDHNDFESGQIGRAQDGDSATLKFTYTLSEDTPNSVQGETAGIEFVGEARSVSN